MPTKIPIRKRGHGPDNDPWIELTSVKSSTKHTIRKDEIVRFCQSTTDFPGSRIWFRTDSTAIDDNGYSNYSSSGNNMTVLEGYDDLLEALCEPVKVKR